jgi:hypothetical protein
MRWTIILSCLLPLGVAGQDLSRYLEGAVPVKEGKVVFTREVHAPGYSRETIFARVGEMAAGRFKTGEEEQGSVTYSNADEGVTICRGREYLVFTRKALVLDRALVDYQVAYTCRDGGCAMEVTRVRYLYGEEKKEQLTAEEWITDEHAYNKKRGRLLRGSDKFRVKTVDLVDGLEELLRKALQVNGSPGTTTAAIAPAPSSSREGYQRVLPAEINGNFINMLQNGRLTLHGERQQAVSTRWGGIGYLFDRPVVYCFATAGEGERGGEACTLSWTPVDPAWGLYREVVFECRALLSRSLAGEEPGAGREGRLLVAEIIATWVK